MIQAMRECSYEVYLAIYQAVRQGLTAGDGGIIGRVSMHLAGRDSVTSLAATLAMIDAKRGDPERSRERLCGDVRCDGKCPAWRSGGGSCGS